MKVMLDSGASTSLINKAALTRMHHLSIQSTNARYMMADGHTSMKTIGTVKIFIEFNRIRTNIIVDVVDSLCTDCLLGMDYINKYRITLNNHLKQVHVHTFDKTTIIPMVSQPLQPMRLLCRVAQPVYLKPYQEQRIKISSQASSGQLLFTPSYRVTKNLALVLPHSLIVIHNHIAWLVVYNPTAHPCYLKQNMIIGVTTPFTSDMHISTILDSPTQKGYDENHSYSFTGDSVQNVKKLLSHIEDPEQMHSLMNVLKKHHTLFDTTITTIAETSIPHMICTGNNPPTTSKPYPQTMEKQRATFDIIQQMLKHKQIRPSSSQYSAPILLIKKKDGSYRFIVDYRKLNNITISDNYPLPNLEEAIQMVGGNKYYTKLDLRSGYFQIPIREDDKHKTAFISVHGLYEFNVLAQGLKNSPPSFQRIMSNVLLPCKRFCLIYLDDILVYSESFQQHVYHLNQVLAILNKHKFQLNPQKCDFAKTTIDYLGHTLSAHGIKPLQDRIEKILAIPQPTTLSQANAFIGAIGWYRKFIKDYAKTAAPILAVTNLTTKNRKQFKWEKPQQQAFDELKKSITSHPLYLTYPDQNAPLILSTDASDNCIGGVLYQEINGDRKNIYFYSQMLPKAQRKWSTIEKEALAIYYCVNRMKLYLQGREFIIQTDHCPLRNMHLKPSNNRRVDRISLVLQQYNIREIRHVAGKCNCLADYLTRYPRQMDDDDDFLDPDFGAVLPVAYKTSAPSSNSNDPIANSNIISAVTTRAQAKRQNHESPAINPHLTTPSSLQNDRSRTVIGHDFDVTTITQAQKDDPFFKEKVSEINNNSATCSYILRNDILYKTIRRGVFTQHVIYIPPSLINSVLQAYHDMPWSAHFGFRRTYQKLQNLYWWPDMKNTIRTYINNCLKCQKFNVERRKPSGLLLPITTPPGPFQLIGIDFSGPFPITPQGNRYVLTITDYFTKWAIAIPSADQTAKTTAEAIYAHYITIYGVPATILSDQGSHFNNQLIAAFTQILGCHHIKSTPYHPQTNGVIERFNSTFERQLAKLTNKCINDWDNHLQSIVFAYNTGQHVATKFSPYELQFGCKPKLPPDQPPSNFIFLKSNDYFHHFQKTLRIYHQQARDNVIYNKQNYKKRYDQNRSDPKYKIGDYVLRRIPNQTSKLSAFYTDPMIIIKVQHPTYWIKNPHDQQSAQVHVSQIRRFTFD